ncbi:hypothetical protein C7974DRAFT_40321 [Boeremia exigua]|uniref:uncharacterized protein n=1 Tax=Boeremia exigua TaxID=749465 RepID=UPI001E8D2972|nr:uncharacterized protein C7974DRAFT_40321 [Boeremia exigua]KAH6618997.1 hypothetical protein C7974DRAFT_40321 [Boeremia exigua]
MSVARRTLRSRARSCGYIAKAFHRAFVASVARLVLTVQRSRAEDKTYLAALMGRWAELELTSSLLTVYSPVVPPCIRWLRTGACDRSGVLIWGTRVGANEPVEPNSEPRNTYAVVTLRPIKDIPVDVREDRFGMPRSLQRNQGREQARLATDFWFENRVDRDSDEIVLCRDT